MHFIRYLAFASLALLLVGCASEVFVCSEEPLQSVLFADKPSDGVQLLRIYNSKKVVIRYDGKVATALPGEVFRYQTGEKAHSVKLDSVNLDSGKVVISGVASAFVMRSTSDQHATAATIVRPTD